MGQPYVDRVAVSPDFPRSETASRDSNTSSYWQDPDTRRFGVSRETPRVDEFSARPNLPNGPVAAASLNRESSQAIPGLKARNISLKLWNVDRVDNFSFDVECTVAEINVPGIPAIIEVKPNRLVSDRSRA